MDGSAPAVPPAVPAAVAPAAPPKPAGPLRRLWSRGVAAWQLGNRLAFGVAPVLLGAFAVAAVLQEASRQPIEVGALSVPPALAETGLTPEVAALRLMDAIDATARAVHAETMHRPSAELEGSAPDINIPVAGLSLRSVAGVVRGLLGWPERRLSGEIVASGDRLRLRLRLAGHGVVAELDGPAADGADALLLRAAPELWRVVAPRLYAWHVVQSGSDAEEVRDRLTLLRRRAPDAETAATITYLLARSLVQSGRAAEALGMLDALAAAQPAYAAAQYGRAMALRALGRAEAALDAQARGLALDPNSPWAHLASAELLRDLDRLEPALAAARRAQELDDDDRPGLVAEAHVLRRMARLGEAAAAARRAVALDRGYAPALAALGSVLLAGGDGVAALAAFDQAVGQAPGLAEAHLGRAQALRALGHLPEAREALRRARALGLDDATARQLAAEMGER
jgi:tetratricopeptide (TPR) repeat protein